GFSLVGSVRRIPPPATPAAVRGPPPMVSSWSGARSRPVKRGAPVPARLLVQPDVVEPRSLRFLVEALELLRRRPEPVEITVADRRHLLIPELVHLLPERVALLRIGLLRHLLHEPLNVRVAGPARPGTGQHCERRRLEDVAGAGGEGLVL